jgi:HEAT repeat protein
MTLLHQEVTKFREWVSSVEYLNSETLNVEDACIYSEWWHLFEIILTFLTTSINDHWTDKEVDDILYVMSWDNECENLVDEIEENPNSLIKLANLALNSSEDDAKWQLADRLGNLSGEPAESLLLKFVNDKDEYVPRRALIALSRMKSPYAEALAEKSWETGEEYQRIAALWVLKDISSSKLGAYLQKAREDGRQFVIKNADQIQELLKSE